MIDLLSQLVTTSIFFPLSVEAGELMVVFVWEVIDLCVSSPVQRGGEQEEER